MSALPYTKFYGFEGARFGTSSDPSFIFAHNAYSDARAKLLEAMRQGEGVLVLTGAPGTGKTILVNDLAAQLASDGSIVGKVSNPMVDADDLPLLVAFAFGIKADTSSKANVLTNLKEGLIDNNPRRQSIIVLIDEAQSLSVEAIRELHLLFDLLAGRGYAVKVLLAGQDRLWERLRQPECAGVQHLITASCTLHPLRCDELRDYLAHVLTKTGWRGNPEVSADALHLIYQRADGVPRLINLVTRRLLLHGSLDEVRVLEESHVESVLEQMVQDHPDLALDTSKKPERPPSPAESLRSLDLQSLEDARPTEHTLRERQVFPANRHEFDATVGSSIGRLRRVSYRNLTMALGAVFAAVIFVLPLLPSYLDEGTGTPTAPHGVDLGTKPRLAHRQSRPQLRPENVAQSLESDKHLAPTNDKVDCEIRDRGEESKDAGPSGAADTSAIAGSVPTSYGIQNTLGETQEIREPVEIVKTAPSSDEQVESQGGVREADEEVAALLNLAKTAMAENKLTVPSDDNAYTHYQAALKLDPENAEAKAGIQRIVRSYGQLANKQLSRGDRKTARLFASRGLKISPRDAQLLALEKQASKSNARRKQAPAPQVATKENKTPETTRPRSSTGWSLCIAPSANNPSMPSSETCTTAAQLREIDWTANWDSTP
jgi:general secretion pathway protein A